MGVLPRMKAEGGGGTRGCLGMIGGGGCGGAPMGVVMLLPAPEAAVVLAVALLLMLCHLLWKLMLLCLPLVRGGAHSSPSRRAELACIVPLLLSRTRCGYGTPGTLTKPVFGAPFSKSSAFGSCWISGMFDCIAVRSRSGCHKLL